MPIELKEVVEFLGYKPDDFKDLTELKTKFDSDFVRANNINAEIEPVKKLLGQAYSTMETELKKFAKNNELDIDFDNDDLKGKKISEKTKYVFSKYEDKNKSTIEELKVKASQGNDEKVKEWETKYEKATQKVKDFESLLKSTKQELEEKENKYTSEIKGVKLGIHKSKIYGDAKFIPEANEFTKKGFIADFESKYDLSLDENDTPIITDKKGQRIPNPKVSGTWYDPSSLLKEETIKANLYPLNKDGGKTKPADVVQLYKQQDTTQVRKVAKRVGG